jgi:hypothetical protein
VILGFSQAIGAATLFPNRSRGWNKIPTIVVLGAQSIPIVTLSQFRVPGSEFRASFQPRNQKSGNVKDLSGFTDFARHRKDTGQEETDEIVVVTVYTYYSRFRVSDTRKVLKCRQPPCIFDLLLVT